MALTIPHRIVVAPSGFKESLSTQEVAESIAAGVRRVLPGTDVRTFPVVDGGVPRRGDRRSDRAGRGHRTGR